MSATVTTAVSAAETRRTTYYRPELDALRFFSFLCVFLHHGPEFYHQPDAALWKVCLGEIFSIVRSAGMYGMSMFFLLSSFLITELLLREKEKYGDIHLKAFYARRILRIWPLYYLGVFLAVLMGHFLLQFWMPHIQILAYLLFAVVWFGPNRYTPFQVLWSIGVEEQFYAVWPLLAKLGGAVLIRRACYVVILISFAAMAALKGSIVDLWFNPLVEFLFFAVGGLVALRFHHRSFHALGKTRALLFGIGITLWLAAQVLGAIAVSVRLPIVLLHCGWYALGAVGTVLIFLAFFGAPEHYFPRWLLYLGKISYGLYVFHSAVMELVKLALPPIGYQAIWVGCILAISLPLTIGVATLSFYGFERPFLRLKAKFEFVRTR